MRTFEEIDQAEWEYISGKYGKPTYKSDITTNTYKDEFYEFLILGKKCTGKIRVYANGRDKKFYMWR